MLVATWAAIPLRRLLHEQSRPFKVRLIVCSIYSFDTVYDLSGIIEFDVVCVNGQYYVLVNVPLRVHCGNYWTKGCGREAITARASAASECCISLSTTPLRPIIPVVYKRKRYINWFVVRIRSSFELVVLLSHRSILSCFAESPFYIFPNWKLLNGDSAEWKILNGDSAEWKL